MYTIKTDEMKAANPIILIHVGKIENNINCGYNKKRRIILETRHEYMLLKKT